MASKQGSRTAATAKVSDETPMHEWLLENSLVTKRTCFVTGSPGTGKTYTVHRIAREHGWRVFTLLASLRDPTDFLGLPMRDGDRTVHAAPSWALEAAAAAEPVVLFFDEIDKAAPVVQGACLRIADERVVGDGLHLGPETRVVFASNPAEFGGFDVVDALANRARHIRWEPSPAQVAAAIASCAVELAEQRGVAVEHANRYGALVASFVTRRGDLLRPPKDRAARQGAWASPRTLTHCAVSLASVPAGDATYRNACIVSEVGDAVGSELIAFLERVDLPDPEEVLAGRRKLDPEDEMDRLHASLTALVGAVSYRPTADRWTRCVEVLGEVAERHPDLAVPSMRRAVGLAKEHHAEWPDLQIPSSVENLGDLLTALGKIQ